MCVGSSCLTTSGRKEDGEVLMLWVFVGVDCVDGWDGNIGGGRMGRIKAEDYNDLYFWLILLYEILVHVLSSIARMYVLEV